MPAALPIPIQQALARGATVLTPNQRAARTLRHQFDAQQLAETWTPPELLALDSWLPHLYTQMLLAGHTQRILLNRTQEHALWQAIIAADPEVSALANPDALAEMAASAWATLLLYNGRHHLPTLGVSTDTRAFARWAQTFDRQCQRRDYLSPAQLPATLEQALAEALPPIPNAGLLLVDFDHLAPAHQTLFTAIEQAGYQITHHRTSIEHPTLTLHTSPDPAHELQSAAHWIQAHLTANPDSRIAVVVPDLANRRPEITRTFAEILATHQNRITAPQAFPFEFSLGQPLTETALVATALTLLHLAQHALPISTLSDLLLAPDFAPSLAAAEFDAHELRETRLLRPELTLPALIRLLEQSRRAPRLQPLLSSLKATQTAAQDLHLNTPDLQFHADWAESFRTLLRATGWPAPTADPQLQTRFDATLDELATLDFDGQRTSAAGALTALTRIASQTIFAPPGTAAPVQILGPLELAAETFDALWFLSAGDLTWPIPASTTPLIPWQIQQLLGIPGADRTRDHTRACALTARLAHAAPQAVFSYPQALTGQEGHQRPSPALPPLLPHQQSPLPTLPAPLPYQTVPEQSTLPPLPDHSISGGAQILQHQAACAFRAFAEHRLSSSAPGTRSLGLNPGERGSIVHKVMELFWTRVQGKIELVLLTSAERAALLDQAIAEALARPRARALSPWDAAYLDTQAERLRQLLNPWLDYESARPDFAVDQSEKSLTDAQLGPLRLTLRVDRIDLTDLGPVILDYKTGLATPSEWLTDRPDQPQLPLYAILTTPPPAGLAFALLRPGQELCLKGFATSEDVFGKTAKLDIPLEDQLADWRRVLHALAEDFAAGESTPAPKSYPKTCTYCDQRILCRLDLDSLTEICDEDDQDPQPGPGTEAHLHG